MKTSTEHINALNDLQPGESIEFNFDPLEDMSKPFDELLEWDGISAEAFEAITNLKNQTLDAMSALGKNLDAMSELGEWKDVEGYPNYQISSTGAFMNKRTLKMLKHFVHVHGHGPVVTLYRGGKGDVLSVEALLKDHFGPEAVLPTVSFFSHKFTEVAPPKAKKKAYKKY